MPEVAIAKVPIEERFVSLVQKYNLILWRGDGGVF